MERSGNNDVKSTGVSLKCSPWIRKNLCKKKSKNRKLHRCLKSTKGRLQKFALRGN